MRQSLANPSILFLKVGRRIVRSSSSGAKTLGAQPPAIRDAYAPTLPQRSAGGKSVNQYFYFRARAPSHLCRAILG